jgi:uncharacterized membrane protein YhaH (DUF805 family)
MALIIHSLYAMINIFTALLLVFFFLLDFWNIFHKNLPQNHYEVKYRVKNYNSSITRFSFFVWFITTLLFVFVFVLVANSLDDKAGLDSSYVEIYAFFFRCCIIYIWVLKRQCVRNSFDYKSTHDLIQLYTFLIIINSILFYSGCIFYYFFLS